MTAAALALSVFTVLAAATPALAVDLEEPCSLLVEVDNDLLDDLLTASVAIDLYLVAEAQPSANTDGYTLRMLEPYPEPDSAGSMDNAAWQRFAQSAASVALEEGTPVVTDAHINEEITETDGGDPLSAGLYLLIAHSEIEDDYLLTEQDENGNDTLVTAAWSEDYEYHFSPELIVVPMSENGTPGVIGEEGSFPYIDGGEERAGWSYSLTVALKFSRLSRYGALEITKSLLSYETSEPATFVFDVTAEIGGEIIFSDVAALTFTAPGQKTALIGRIPVGAVVTVTEVYSGARYRVTGDLTKTATISAVRTVGVEFENDYTETPRGGHGITNNFTYDGETWIWIQTTGDNP